MSAVNNCFTPALKPLETTRQVCLIGGCGHSGTTLVAAKISNHPRVFGLGRETNAFAPRKGLYFSREVLREWCLIAEQLGKTHIVEKTPKHVHAIDRIRTAIPSAKFVLIVRNPLDNCASLFSRFNDLNYAIERWIMDNSAILKYSALANVMTIRYEDLTRTPDKHFKLVSDFLNLEWDPSILEEGKTVFDNLTQCGNMQLRREQVSRSIMPNMGKWKTVFNRMQMEQVLAATDEVAAKLGFTYADLDLNI